MHGQAYALHDWPNSQESNQVFIMSGIRVLSVFVVLGVLVAFSGCSQSRPVVQSGEAPVVEHPNTSEWQDLFAADLSNAVLADDESWVIEDGILKANDRSTLWTKESYGNFVLDLEFRTPRQANSGIFIRTADPKDILSALEVQIHETTDNTPHGQVGAIYDLLSPRMHAAKPAGEWNRYTITADDNLIQVILNGRQIIDMDLNDWTEPNRNPDGTPNKFNRAIRDQAKSGPIGFQGIHGPTGESVEFRNIKIRRLD